MFLLLSSKRNTIKPSSARKQTRHKNFSFSFFFPRQSAANCKRRTLKVFFSFVTREKCSETPNGTDGTNERVKESDKTNFRDHLKWIKKSQPRNCSIFITGWRLIGRDRRKLTLWHVVVVDCYSVMIVVYDDVLLGRINLQYDTHFSPTLRGVFNRNFQFFARSKRFTKKYCTNC